MTNFEITISHFGIKYNTSNSFLKDIKLLKKINTVLEKYIRTEKEIYLLECINILKILKFSFDIEQGKEALLDYINEEHKGLVSKLIGKVNEISLD